LFLFGRYAAAELENVIKEMKSTKSFLANQAYYNEIADGYVRDTVQTLRKSTENTLEIWFPKIYFPGSCNHGVKEVIAKVENRWSVGTIRETAYNWHVAFNRNDVQT